MAKLTTDEKKWRAESDLYTLMEAEKIKSDKTRLNMAKKHAKVVANEKMKEANAVKKLAKPIKPVKKKTTKAKKRITKKTKK